MDKNYRMSKATKTQLALGKWETAEKKNQYKRLMITAEYTAANTSRATLSKVDKNAND
jgi:hypothetical protein